MEKAIKEAKKGVKKGDSPFGACIAKNGKIIAVGHSTVLSGKNATNHAEINAIRKACKKLKSHKLKGCIIYSTTEPCPMCFSAIHWAEMKEIVFGTTIEDVKKLGFHELTIKAETMKKKGKSGVRIKSGHMRKECIELLEFWKKHGGKTY
ncbi:nucleoside deaminase [Candidatus Micrarchaeota archaeon]|nr:nucleoside deaminase [Candidatus Micrarchaeota archaeon]